MRYLIVWWWLAAAAFGVILIPVEDAVALYDRGQYAKAYEAFTELAEHGSRDAALYLGKMYEQGLGVPKDIAKAEQWYKTAAQRYYNDEHLTEKGEFDTRREEIYRSLDRIENDPEAERTVQQHSRLLFGFNAYKDNFFMPFGYADRSYPSYVPSDRYLQYEAEFQYSFSVDLLSNLFGVGEIYGAAMTQHGFWQVYSPSSPFREINYNPELYVLFPLMGGGDAIGLKSVTVTFSHMSNGQGNISLLDVNRSQYPELDPNWLKNRSRSWNYVSTVLSFQFSQLFADLTLWARTDFAGSDDNPKLLDYLGYGQLDLSYVTGASKFGLMTRLNPATGYGAVQASWSYPVYGRDSIYWYIKVFSGYGESLIDYDRHVNKASIGFSFFR